MSFSWMKSSTFFLSRVLTLSLTLSVALSSSTGFIPSLQAGQTGEDGSSRKNKTSYAQELSETKEQIVSIQEEIESKKEELEIAQEDLSNLRSWDDWKGDDIYGGPCECSEKTSCDVSQLLKYGIVSQEETKTIHLNIPGCASDANGDATRTNPKCKEKLAIANDADSAGVCTKVYAYARDHGRASTGLSSLCIEAARNCGAVKYSIDKARLPGTITDLKKEIARLEKEKKKLIARRKSIDMACPDCSVIVEQSERPGLGDYIVGGLQAVSPMVVAGIQAGSYNKYLKTSLNAYNGYLSNSLANCQGYYDQGTITGIPSSPCASAMWSGGIAQAPGGGGYGIYGSIGAGGGIGAMYGMPGGYAAGYGAYGYGGGGYSGAIGVAIGGMYGGSYGGAYGGGFPGAYGGAYTGGFGAGIGMYGGAFNGSYAGGFGASYVGGIGAYGGGYPGGIGAYGASFAGGIGAYGGGYAGGIGAYGGGAYTSTMGYAGSYGYGVDPSGQLNAARMQMQQQNMQISQQQMMESQYRAQQVQSGIGGFNYGAGYGGYGYGAGYGGGYGAGYGGYGYGYGTYGNGYGYGAQAIGTAIGSLFGSAF
jgi:hypothetical protein